VQIGSVLDITRYPVKSMGGERLDRVAVTRRGLDGDRVWAVYTADGRIGSGKNSWRFRRVDGLLDLRSRRHGDGTLIELPDGSTAAAGDPDTDRRLSAVLGRPVTVRTESTLSHHDDSPLHLVTTASLRRLGDLFGEPVDARRMRANLLLDVAGSAFAENGWHGRELRIGDTVVLTLGAGMTRCVMVNAPQRTLPPEPGLLKLIGTANELELGLQAAVARTGDIAVGDPVRLTGPAE
jgi:uncharacterized protein YcbX